MMHRRSLHRSGERGAIAVIATFFALVVAGLAFGLLTEVGASKKMADRGESNLRSLEAAEAGVAFAEEEISSNKDTGVDGIGNLTGTFGGASYAVTATQDPVFPDRWTLVAKGVAQGGGREIEVRIQKVPTTIWQYGMFAQNSITISGGATTDSYDSRIGSYASQATNKDKFGKFALQSGPIGCNGSINISSSEIRGDCNAGPGFTSKLSGSAKVTGSNVSLKQPIDIPDTSLAEFTNAAMNNDNGAWQSTGKLTYDPKTMVLTVSGGGTVTLTKSTYFFSKIILSGNSTLKITNGPVKLYVTDQLDFSGGTVVNATNEPANLQMFQEAYELPAGYKPSKKTATLSGGSSSAFTYYGPSTPITISGQGDICGAIVGKSITSSGGSKLHFDLSLLDSGGGGVAHVRRIYWRDLALPLR